MKLRDKKNKVVIIAFLLLVGVLEFGESVRAQTISGVNTTNINNGDSITVYGSNFGVKPQTPPLISSYNHPSANNNFHNMVVNNTAAANGDWTARSSSYVLIHNNSAYARSQFKQSDKYCEINNGIGGGFYPTLRYTDSPSSNVYHYVSFWFYETASSFTVSANGGNSKFFAYVVNTGSPNDWRYTQFVTSNEPDGGLVDRWRTGSDSQIGDDIDYTNYMPADPWQTWHHFELWTYTGTVDTQNAFWHFMLDGKKIIRWGDIDPQTFGMVSTSRPHNWNAFLFGQCSGRNNDGGYFLVDQVYIDNTQAHVFISNKSDIMGAWDNVPVTHHNEIQVPSTWSNDSITFTVNQGSFSDGEMAYLYVVDSKGNISEGYPITFGDDTHQADLNDDGVINMKELISFIARWKAGDGVTRQEVEEARGIWFNGGRY